MIGIYKITSPSGKIYIGQSVNIEKRLIIYRNNLCRNQPRLKNSISKYGYENHTIDILEECNECDLNKKERYWQDFYDACGVNGLNCMLTTDGNVASKHSDETRAKISKSQKGMKKKPLSDETKRKLSIINTGKKHSEETKIKMGLLALGNKSRTGQKISEHQSKLLSERMKGNKINLGRRHSEERKAQISEQHKGNKYCLGIKHSEETKYKVSENSSKSILIFNSETGIFYNSLKAASDSIGNSISSAHISRMIKGRWPNRTSFIFA